MEKYKYMWFTIMVGSCVGDKKLDYMTYTSWLAAKLPMHTYSNSYAADLEQMTILSYF